MADESDLAEVLHVPADVQAPAAASPAPELAGDSLAGVTADVSGTPIGSTGPPGYAVNDAANPLGAPLAAGSQPGAAGAGGGAYTIDVENAPQAIANLRAAADLLEFDLRRQAEELGDIQPPGKDEVSEVATNVFRDAAIGPAGVRNALLSTAAEYRRQADKLQADLASYLQAEEANIALPPAQSLDFWRKV